jgi:hypothetical protein
MTTMVDFLPAAYRADTRRRRALRERLLLTIPVILALVAVDAVMRIRVSGVRDMAHNAKLHAEYGARLAEEAKELSAKASELHTAVGDTVRPLDARRMTELVDELLAGRPTAISLHELVVHQTPWATESVPTITVGASSDTSDALKTWLDLVRASDVLPPLQCQRADQARDGSAFVFLLENKSVRRPR